MTNKPFEKSQSFEPANQNGPARNMLTDLQMALRFYSRLPAGRGDFTAPVLSHMAPALPFASLAIGALPALAIALAALLGVNPYLSAVFAVAVFVVLTGAMSEDALADSFDGLFGGKTPDHRLEIMRDSHLGTYGVTAIGLLLLMRITALASLTASKGPYAALLWIAATMLARSTSLALPIVLPSARPDGLAASTGKLERFPFALGLAIAIISAFILAAPLTSALCFIVALVVISICVTAWITLCRRKVGGYSGDLIGGLQAVLEIAALATFSVFVGQ